jgi:hypothetical protein
VNTNYRPPNNEAGQLVADKLYEAADQFLTPDGISAAIKLISAYATMADIKSVDVAQWAVEVGTHVQGQRVHLHAFIKIKHSAVIQLNVADIKQFFEQRMVGVAGIRSCAVHVRWIPATDELTKAYINKTVYKPPASVL